MVEWLSRFVNGGVKPLGWAVVVLVTLVVVVATGVMAVVRPRAGGGAQIGSIALRVRPSRRVGPGRVGRLMRQCERWSPPRETAVGS